MALLDLANSGTTLSTNYYMRNFYNTNRDAHTNSKRQSMSSTDLSLADGLALRRAVRALRSADFSTEQNVNVRNRVLAYIETYNNVLSSTSDTSDRTLMRDGKQLKNITNEYAAELDKIGITIKEDGTLASRDSLFKSADISKFEKLFSKDSDYMQRTLSCAKKIEHHSEALRFSEQNRAAQTAVSNKAPSAASSGLTSSAKNAPGSHINIVL